MTDLVRIDETVRQQLAEIRAARPAPRNLFAAAATTLTSGAAAVASALTLTANASAGVIVLSLAPAVWYWLPTRRWRRWMRRFSGVRTADRIECAVATLPKGLTLRYRVLMEAGVEWLVLTPFPRRLGLGPGRSPILDPAFDRDFGVDGRPAHRALLGQSLRENAPIWFAAGQLVIEDGEARVRIGEGGVDVQEPSSLAALAALEAYGARLDGLISQALIEQAQDLDAPFDAARALAAIDVHHPERIPAVLTALEATPAGQAVLRIVRDADGLMHDTLDWVTRSAVVRGALGIEHPFRERLIQAVAGLEVADPARAMAAVEMLEAAHVVTGDGRLLDQAGRHLEALTRHGGQECLAWLRARAVLGRAERARFERFAARIQQAHGGQLSLEPRGHGGGLSEVVAGEVAIGDERADGQD